MSSRMHMPRVGVALAALALVALTIACGGDGARAESASAESSGAPRAAIRTQPFDPDPCMWATVADVEGLFGKVHGEPSPGKSAENPTPQDDGRACVYRIGGTEAEPEAIAVQVIFEDATAYDAGYGMVMDATGLAGSTGEADTRTGESEKGWDFTAGIGREWVGRLGHMAVSIGVFAMNVPAQAPPKLAALVRDRVPDLPVAAEHGDPNSAGRGPDPCALVTQVEAEAVLGKLPVPPYRSDESSPFADGSGGACTYYLGRHRTLTITPHWSDAKWLFGTAGGLTDEITSKLGVTAEAADTLEGPWEQSKADINGTLNFLTGDRMIEMQYRTAAIQPAGAVQLARIAVERLAAAP